MIEGWTPLISSQLTTVSRVREMTASKVLRLVPVDLGPVAGLPGEHVLLGRLIQHHIHKAVASVEAAFLLEDR